MGSLRRLLIVIAALAMVAAVGRTASAQELCFGDIDCDDSNSCTFDHCVFFGPFPLPPGTCFHDVLTGPACDDGDACTQSDTCRDGFCSGTNICTCDGGCGCGPDGSCDDGNPCTVDACANFIDCFGCCHATIPNDGLRCTDGNACTQVDTCLNGACMGGNPVVCPRPDQCHTAGTCDPATGACSDPVKANGTPCNDGSQCTRSDSCQAGVCVGAEPIVCPVADQCSGAGACDPATGTCTAPKKPDGAPCDDGDRCTRTDTCMAGACVGANPVVCAAADQCHDVGVCERTSGVCSTPAKGDGAPCDDGNPATGTSACVGNVCRGVQLILTVPPDIKVPNPKQAVIPVTIELPGNAATGATTVQLQSFVACADVPALGGCMTKACRKLQQQLAGLCGSSQGAVRFAMRPQAPAGFVAVTRKVSRTFKASRRGQVRVKLRLNKLGRALLAQGTTLSLQTRADVQEHKGSLLGALFKTLLSRL